MTLLITSGSLNRVRTASALALTLTFIMIISLFPLQSHSPSLDEVEQRREQFGGGGSIEEQCSSITFEDMFIYDKALFDIQVDEDWQTAQVAAMAWINWTLADDIRDDLDEYLEGIVPSGGDDWLSTDEVGAVILIAADCLQYSITRIGIRDGAAHRGGVSVDWKNTTWQDDGMVISEYNGVPSRHAEGRECQGFNQGDCYEIPVRPSVERDCDTEINGSEGADECRVILWLNATLQIDGVSDPNDFTIAFNSSNMSNARLDFTFPHIPDLRLDLWEECEGRYVGPDEDNPSGGATPMRGSCIGDGSSTHELRPNEDGSLTYTLFPSLERETWPYGEDLYADFTTSPVPVDNPPTWTDAAPEDGSWFPAAEEGQTKWVSWHTLSTWFTDESGVSQLEIACRTGGSGGISQSIDRSLWVTIEGIVEVTCESTDGAGQSSGNRTWNFGVPFTLSTSDSVLIDPHPITISTSSGWPAITVEIGLVQEGQPQYLVMESIDSHTDIDVPSTNILPGIAFVWVRAYHVEGYPMEHIYDLGIVKEGSPPLVTVTSTDWDGTLWKITGQYSDPDGESVYFSIDIDGKEAGAAGISGNTWESDWFDMGVKESGTISVGITGCDESGQCTTISQNVDNSFLFVEGAPDCVDPYVACEPAPPPIDGEGGLLPAAGMPALLLAAVAALMYARRRD
ncbi:MAG: hypothetical protein QF760_02730 [Candidatus Thalassarchaeaceae archaeon]|jgi:hypothetical protein|nr:hypothetical protein [Candidatus Thalassarchaeaceae archaeon]MDP6703424.1 hypothetical protein [Candidatus Thalassarchaeaceae archaeon]MDP7004409.1 hypothetical protein [Candidatus Thalassarchaeaceae archaeon]